MEKNINKLGNLKFNIANNSLDCRKIISHTINLKSQQYSRTNVRNIFSIKNYKLFYESLENLHFKSETRIHCSSLTLNDDTISTHVGFYDNATFYYLMPSFDYKNFSNYGPGSIHIAKLISWCIDNNIYTFDFTTGDEKYKYNWSNNHSYVYDYNQTNSLLGLIYSLFLSIKFISKKILIYLPFLEKLIKKIYYKI